MIAPDTTSYAQPERRERPNLTANELSVEFLNDFGGNLVTENMRVAHELYINSDHLPPLNTLNLEETSNFRDTFEDRKDFNQVMGILRGGFLKWKK